MSVQDEAAERVATAHRAKLAYIYVRQSTAGQVRQHQESTELQYRLVDRAAGLGWPRERIEVVDDDLGKSGTSSTGRQGFQRLIAEIGLGKAGLVLSLDASRLARNNRDWHQLLELCSLFGVLIGDGERLYDPGVYHDRLLLGLSGIMSEAELHQIRIRLHQGERQKALRGELRLPLPAGLAYGRGGEIILNPDEEVQARLQLVFARFRQLQSANAVARDLRRHGLMLPTRPLRGPAPHEVVWVAPDNFRVLQILQRPSYAGAYVWGQRRQDPTRRRAGTARAATVRVAVEQWPVCLRDAHPGYIGWEEFMANQKRLSDNAARRAPARPGVPRQGAALLQGIASCGRCGRRMSLHYSGPHGDYPVYLCRADQARDGQPRCQEVRALQVDAEVERVLLASLAPDRIALAAAAVGQIEAEARMLERQWSLKRERARYEAERARRQYDAVEPENRLVARSLERDWEEKLRQAEAVEQAYERWRGEQPGPVSPAEKDEVLALAQDLPRVWQAAMPSERKQMLRLVISEVMLDQRRGRGQIWMRIIWQTGASSEHLLQRRVRAYAECVSAEHLERRVRELNAEGRMDRQIADLLNAERIMSARGVPFRGETVHLLRKRWNIRAAKINGVAANPPTWPDGSYSVQGAAEALGITAQTVFKWLRKGRLAGHQTVKGQPWQIHLPDERIALLKTQVRRNSGSKKEAS
ncbi:recombinase family protein [Roseomonas sp. SSH11]|uniref:Recombinase family protein n=1 Tax=Pararoseomonas baculiformis TaxID=2820812 RepID=A0ABS4ALY2_9PROT|nr:recombinase family protein [Pararoseomonas baculiformis]MBP0447896.1 recombinase family protein [Pararoseomonas baculiformis]